MSSCENAYFRTGRGSHLDYTCMKFYVDMRKAWKLIARRRRWGCPLLVQSAQQLNRYQMKGMDQKGISPFRIYSVEDDGRDDSVGAVRKKLERQLNLCTKCLRCCDLLLQGRFVTLCRLVLEVLIPIWLVLAKRKLTYDVPEVEGRSRNALCLKQLCGVESGRWNTTAKRLALT